MKTAGGMGMNDLVKNAGLIDPIDMPNDVKVFAFHGEIRDNKLGFPANDGVGNDPSTQAALNSMSDII